LNGQPTLMIRIANARHNTISQATARLWLFRLEHTKERDQLRRYYELELFRQEHPMFSLSWTLVHVIDEASAFRDMTPDEFAEVEGALVLNVGGVDDNSAQRLYARQIYSRDDIRWQHRYRDITSLSKRGRLLLDYTKFHEVEPEGRWAGSSGRTRSLQRANRGPATSVYDICSRSPLRPARFRPCGSSLPSSIRSAPDAPGGS
jgi:inward rectifier potassium channel